MKTPDRIRQRALKNMGYKVHRVRNERIQSAPYAVAADIIQKYYEVADTEDRTAKITKLKATAHHESIPKDIDDNLQFWALEFNKELNDEKWTADYFKESLRRFHPGLVSNQCAMERLVLLLLGLNLRKGLGSRSSFGRLHVLGIELAGNNLCYSSTNYCFKTIVCFGSAPTTV
jgi:hypothetical protein